MISAPTSIDKSAPSAKEISAIPEKLVKIPNQPLMFRRSFKNSLAIIAVKMGAEAISKLAEPAVTVISP